MNTALASLLDRLDIAYERVDHPPVFTCEEAEALVPAIPGTDTKNLVLRDKPGRRHFLVSVPYDHAVDLKALAGVLGVSRLSFASADRLMRHLGVEAGAVSLLAILNDADGAVEVVIDRRLWAADRLKCHPLVNTATLSIARNDLQRFLEATGHPPSIVDVP